MKKLSAVSLFVLLLTIATGCQQPHAAPPPQDKKIDTIVQQSGGNWSSLSAVDQEYLIKEMGHGNPQTAKMNFSARWGRLKGGGVPPTVGGPPR